LAISRWSVVLAISMFAIGVGSCGNDRGVAPKLLGIRPPFVNQGVNATANLTPGDVLFPMVPGNRWHYAVTIRRTWLPSSELPDSVMVSHEVRLREIAAAESGSDGECGLELQAGPRSGTSVETRWVRYRQDRSGLYQAGPPTSQRRECGRSDSLTQWLVLLKYPLHVGSEWQVSYNVHARVEGVDVLDLPAGRFVAYRLRVQYPWMQPGEEYLSWYGRAGLLALRRRALHTPELGPPNYWYDEQWAVDTLSLNATTRSPRE
jgi:hypothetical protein